MQDIDLDLLVRLQRIRHVALDMDGTIYCGGQLFAQTLPFLEKLRTLHIGYTFLTNNSSKNSAEYLHHLAKLGIEVSAQNIFTSGDATIELLRHTAPTTKRVFVVGTEGLRSQLRAAGFVPLGDEDLGEETEIPEAVIVGFDTRLNYDVLCKAAYWIGRGVPYYATHPDCVCPTDLPMVLLDCGAVCAAIESATGRKPDAIAGKPEPAMLESLAQRCNMDTTEILMVGDRLYTDVLMANRANAVGVLTLTGESQRVDVQNSRVHPDLIINHLGELASLIETAQLRRAT